MMRKLVVSLAVVSILSAGVLLGTGSTASVSGQELSCDGPIVRAEGNGPGEVPDDAIGAALAQQCEEQDQQQLNLGVVAALIGVTLGAVVSASGSPAAPSPTVDARVG